MGTTGQCKIGESSLKKTARKAWQAANKLWKKIRGSRAVEAISNPVGSLPAPPAPNTPDAAKCMETWMECYTLATMLDDCVKYITVFKAHYAMIQKTYPIGAAKTALLLEIGKYVKDLLVKQDQLVATLQAQTAAYLDCMNGMQT